MGLLVNMLGSRVPSFQTTTIRFFIQAACSLAMFSPARRRGLHRLETWLGKPHNRWLLMSRAAFGACGMSCYFFALSYPGARLSDVTVLVFLNVPLTGLFAYFCLREAFGWMEAATTTLSMVGVLLVAQPASIFGADDEAASQPVQSIVIAVSLLGAVSSAVAYLAIRKIGPNEDTLVMVLYFSVLGCFVGPLGGLVVGQTWISPSPTEAVMLIAVGVLGFLGHLLLNRGVQIAPAGPAAVMRYTDVLFSMLFQTTVLSNPPNALKLVGCALIMSCIVSVLSRQRQKAAKARAEKAAAAAAAALTGIESTEQPAAGAGAAFDEDTVWIGKLAAHSPARACIVCGLHRLRLAVPPSWRPTVHDR
jgi:drug/metabolite transporter (DMT)-like permease